jgi:hypothetical protein
MHRAARIGLILVVVCLSGCDRAPPDTASQQRPEPEAPAPAVPTTRPDQAERALGLTRRLPHAYVASCARIRSQAGADPCPPLIPQGQLKVAGPYERRWEGYPGRWTWAAPRSPGSRVRRSTPTAATGRSGWPGAQTAGGSSTRNFMPSACRTGPT